MRITISRQDLARVLSAVTKVVEGRNTIPILSNVLLSVANGTLTVRATDLDIEASASVALLDATDGRTTVEAKLLADIAKKATGDIAMDLDSNTLTVKSGKSRFKLQTLPAEDYPSLSAGTFDTEFEVDLAALVAPVQFAISTEETRYYLNGVFLHAVEDGDFFLTAVATDGHRLARHRGLLPEGLDTATIFKGVILPRKLVSLLPKGKVLVGLSATKVQIASADGVLTSKLIDGTFPDYQRVIPRNNDKLITVEGATLRSAVDRVAVISTERGGGVKLAFASGGATVSLRTDNGSAEEEIAVAYDGEPIDIGFNSKYVGDVFGIFPAGDIRLALNDGGSPALVTSEAAPDLLAVLMPCRV